MKAVQGGKTHKADQRHGETQLDPCSEEEKQHHETRDSDNDLTHIDPSGF